MQGVRPQVQQRSLSRGVRRSIERRLQVAVSAGIDADAGGVMLEIPAMPAGGRSRRKFAP